MTTSNTPGVLLAVLLNPPRSTAGTRTRNAVERAARVLGYERAAVVNLFWLATRSVVELNGLATTEESWRLAREEMEVGLRSSCAILAAWGVSGVTGAARQARDEQVAWLAQAAMQQCIEDVWMVGGQPRHPSRWHQYVSDKYARTSGGNFDERLGQVLQSVLPKQLVEVTSVARSVRVTG